MSENPHSGIGIWLAIARAADFPHNSQTNRPKSESAHLRSAPLSRETQLFFMMLGIPVLQVYGLTETTAICTHGDPRSVEPGWVGSAMPGIEMKLGADQRNPGARPECISRLLESPGRNCESPARWMVPHRRSGRSKCQRKLAHHRPHQESADVEFRTQHRARADRRKTCRPRFPARNRSCWSATGEVILTAIVAGDVKRERVAKRD